MPSQSSMVSKSVSLGAAGGSNQSAKSRTNVGLDAGKRSTDLNQLSRNVAEININSAEGSGWEVVSKKTKNRVSAASNAKPWGSAVDPNASGSAEGTQMKGPGGEKSSGNRMQVLDYRKPNVSGNPQQQQPKGQETAKTMPPPVIPPPLQHGWQWDNRGGSAGIHSKTQGEDGNLKAGKNSHTAYGSELGKERDDASDDDDGGDLLDDSDYDLSDDYDSDASEKSYETRKKNKWLKPLFEALDKLTEEQINDPNRQWHCPACYNGPGAIDWYRGLQPLMTHARTRGTRRVKLHRELAALLEEELRRKGTSVVQAGEVFGKWKGLSESTADHAIVWPPMVVIMNTILEKDENDKWIGMGNQELVDYFGDYDAVRARHSYGPTGHRGMSVLIFDASALGYLEAELLHKQFVDEGRDRNGWHQRRVLFYPGGKRQLYGFLATKEDIDVFNQHAVAFTVSGKSRLKFELKSYQQMVLIPMRQMNQDNQKLSLYKKRAAKQEQHSKAIEVSFGVVSQKLRERIEENRIIRLRTMMQQEENREEMDYQESFFKEQIEKIHKATEERERKFETLLHLERAKARQSSTDFGTIEEQRQRNAEIQNFISCQVKGVEEFEARREELISAYRRWKVDMKRKHQKEEVLLEEELHTALAKLMQEYAPAAIEPSDGA